MTRLLNRPLLALLLAASGVAALFALGWAPGLSDGEAAGPPITLSSALGRTTVDGQAVYVHVTVATVAGGDPARAAVAALEARGATPVQSAEYTKNGTWSQFKDGSVDTDRVDIVYLGGEPNGQSYYGNDSIREWSTVPGSAFKFLWTGTGSGCPSLVAECPEDQAFNQTNEAGWTDLGGWNNFSITLGITYSALRTRGGPFAASQEADMALNTNDALRWGDRTAGYNDPDPFGGGLEIDTLTIAAHELGHMAGLGHSSDSAALMYSSYEGARDVGGLLGDDDRAGIVALYPDGTSTDGGTTGGSWCDTHDPSHPQWTRKGCS